MAKAAALPRDDVAHAAIRHAYDGGRLQFYTDQRLLGRPGSPVYNGLDVFVPSLVLFASSLTLLFAFGMLHWLVALSLVLLYQIFGAPRLVHWRLHRRCVQAVLRNPYNLTLLWGLGGIAMALKDWPEKCCIAPSGNWQAFARDFLMEPAAEAPAASE